MNQLVPAGLTWEAVGAIAGAAAVVGAAVTTLFTRLLPWLRGWLDGRSLRHRLGAVDYHPAVLASAVRNYVQPLCGDVDPAGREDYRSVLPVSRPLFQVLDEALHHARGPQYLLLLADSGMGKTSALINYYARNLRRWRRRLPITLLYLGRRGVLDRIRSVANKADAVLFLDALDEDPDAIRDHRGRVKELMQAAEGFRAVVLSCRTQFFFKDEEITSSVGIARLGPRPAGEPGEYRFQKLYLLPFSDRQVDRFLRNRYSLWRWRGRQRARDVLARVGDLSARPMLLAYVDDLVSKGERLDSLVDAYERIVQAWLDREESHVGNVASLRSFCEQLAVDIYLRREERGGEHVSVAEIASLAARWNITLERWKLTGRSLLNRDGAGNYKFAHRSILEYLFVRTCTRPAGDHRAEQDRLVTAALEVDWTDHMRRFALDFLRDKGRRTTLACGVVARREAGNPEDAPLLALLIRDQLRMHGLRLDFRNSRLPADDPALVLLELCDMLLIEEGYWTSSAFVALNTTRQRPDQLLRLHPLSAARDRDGSVHLAAGDRPASIPFLSITERGPQGFVLSLRVAVGMRGGTRMPALIAPLVLKGIETVWLEFEPAVTDSASVILTQARMGHLLQTVGLPLGSTHTVVYPSWKDAVRDSEGHRRRPTRVPFEVTR